jgi:hypothetical protein
MDTRPRHLPVAAVANAALDFAGAISSRPAVFLVPMCGGPLPLAPGRPMISDASWAALQASADACPVCRAEPALERRLPRDARPWPPAVEGRLLLLSEAPPKAGASGTCPRTSRLKSPTTSALNSFACWRLTAVASFATLMR